MPLPNEIFNLNLSDYMFERYKRLERNTIYNIFINKWPPEHWINVNKLWINQYFGVMTGKINPNILRD